MSSVTQATPEQSIWPVLNRYLEENHRDAPADNDASSLAWSTVVDRLQQFRNLENDWDGQGCEAPESLLIDKAVKLADVLGLHRIPIPDHVYVGVNATIYFEWRDPNGFCEIEVVSPAMVECCWRLTSSSSVETTHMSIKKS